VRAVRITCFVGRSLALANIEKEALTDGCNSISGDYLEQIKRTCSIKIVCGAMQSNSRVTCCR